MNADAQLQEAVVNVEGMARDESARLRAQYGAKARELHDTVERRAEELAGEQRALREDRVAHEAEAREMARRAVSCDKQLALAEEMVRAQASRYESCWEKRGKRDESMTGPAEIVRV